MITLTTALAGGDPGDPVEVLDTVAISDLTREGFYQGEIEFEIGVDPDTLQPFRRIVRTDASSWLAGSFSKARGCAS
jgi:hypothetical protein